MFRLFRVLPALILLIGSSVACSEDKEADNPFDAYENEIEFLERSLDEKESFISALNQELSEINTILDQITDEDGDSLLAVAFSNPVERLQYFDSLLQESYTRIDELEQEVTMRPRSPGESGLAQTVIQELRSNLEEKEEMIANLNQENRILKVQQSQLKERLSEEVETRKQLDSEIIEQEKKLAELRKTREEEKAVFARQKRDLEEDLMNTRNMINAEKAEAHFDIATGLLEQYDEARGGIQIGKKKMRRDLLNSAYQHFREACLLGHSEASTYIRIILTNSDYAKDLEIDQSGKGLTECGI